MKRARPEKEIYYSLSNPEHTDIRKIHLKRIGKRDIDSMNVMWFLCSEEIVFSSVEDYIDRLLRFQQYNKSHQYKDDDWIKIFTDFYQDLCKADAMSDDARVKFINKVSSEKDDKLVDVANAFVEKLDLSNQEKEQYYSALKWDSDTEEIVEELPKEDSDKEEPGEENVHAVNQLDQVSLREEKPELDELMLKGAHLFQLPRGATEDAEESPSKEMAGNFFKGRN